MTRWLMLMSFAVAGLQPAVKKAVTAPAAQPTDAPSYTADGQLKFPAEYREWVFLTSGLDMSYNPKASASTHSVFNNVFVNPSAYRVFVKTGTWPEGTMFMLENRGAEGNHSINVKGLTQTQGVTGTEIHIKDSAHVKGGWAFYNFKDKVSAKVIERPSVCYTCHEEHAAVDTTFVQFYPTLMDIAKEKGVLSAVYLKELETKAAPAEAGK